MVMVRVRVGVKIRVWGRDVPRIPDSTDPLVTSYNNLKVSLSLHTVVISWVIGNRLTRLDFRNSEIISKVAARPTFFRQAGIVRLVMVHINYVGGMLM